MAEPEADPATRVVWVPSGDRTVLHRIGLWAARSGIATICGILILLGSLGPWATGRGPWSLGQTYIPGFMYLQGQLTLLAGVVAIVATARRKRWSDRSRGDLEAACAFGLAAAIALISWWDPSPFMIYPDGSVPIEGWATFGAAWGVRVVAVAAILGFAREALILIRPSLFLHSHPHRSTTP